MLRLIREAVANGEYASTSEVLCDAVRAWHRQRLEDAERLAALRARAQASLADPAHALAAAEANARIARCSPPPAPAMRVELHAIRRRSAIWKTLSGVCCG